MYIFGAIKPVSPAILAALQIDPAPKYKIDFCSG